MAKIYIVQCCFAENIEKTVGPYGDESVAYYVADAIGKHFYNGGDQHTRVVERMVIE